MIKSDVFINEPLAHSSKYIDGSQIPAQSYKCHINNVTLQAKKNAEAIANFCSPKYKLEFVESVISASLFHDLGKLDKKNQLVLLNNENKLRHLPVNHVDAGVALLWKQKRYESAVIAYGHHRGLLSKPKELEKQNDLFMRDPKTNKHTDENLDEYLKVHNHLKLNHDTPKNPNKSWTGLARRIGLSCLVDADHGDTARHFHKDKRPSKMEPRWESRLDALNKYIASIKNSGDTRRNNLRSDIFNACINSPISPSLRSCDSPVGTGKTTAVMAHLLRVAHEKKLRHIFVVLPFTNIIQQSVQIYRKALTLPGEKPKEIIAEHHHQADFSDEVYRNLASLWTAPIIITTAVQFFETIAAASPNRLRKMHELPGSAVFIDEAHAAIPAWQWPQQWLWVQELSEKWGCHFVFASGSLAKFWESQRFVTPTVTIPDLVPKCTRNEAQQMELGRVTIVKRREKPFDRNELIARILCEQGPRLVVLNTLQSAAVLANEMNSAGYDILHLSTALAPIDRNRIINQIAKRLNSKKNKDWTLVATSCVEAGMNFSFTTAFRESCSLASLIQIGGRVNRHGNNNIGKVIDFRVCDELFNENKSFHSSQKVLDEIMMKELELRAISPSDKITLALENELKLSDISKKVNEIKNSEAQMDYPETARLCRVIEADTRLVIVYPEIVKKIEKGEYVIPQELVNHSVQMWYNKIIMLALEQVKKGHNELYKLGNYEYDQNFLGYMKCILPLIYAKVNSCVIV